MTADERAEQIAAALEGNTRAFHNEIALHAEMARAFDYTGIPYQQEVTLPGHKGDIDFILHEDIAVEVKAHGGGGLSPLRQLMRYLEDPRFTLGILVTTRPVTLPVDHFERPDGTRVPIRNIQLWKNAF